MIRFENEFTVPMNDLLATDGRMVPLFICILVTCFLNVPPLTGARQDDLISTKWSFSLPGLLAKPSGNRQCPADKSPWPR
ncbi:MAG: hypothetical protein WAL90_00825, partial [Desulfobacterales bacterium]